MLLKQAVVIGGGIAGLLHARVLADYAEQVTIIDRDQMPQQLETRAGVPQGSHIHYLMVRVLRAQRDLNKAVKTLSRLCSASAFHGLALGLATGG
jgi:2-polyprenyl-6-methoxyphenol hydroxylase-like FAD-dependent oxidoreductase